MHRIQQYDENIVLWIRENISCYLLDTTMKAISFLGDTAMIWIIIILLLFCVKKWRIWGILLAISLVISSFITNILLKPLFCRFRPYDMLSLDIIIAPLQDYSFPSGHTTAAFAGAFILWHINKIYGRYAFLFAAIMAFSRVYLSVHYPTDVLIGAVVGSVSSWLVITIYQKVFLFAMSVAYQKYMC